MSALGPLKSLSIDNFPQQYHKYEPLKRKKVAAKLDQSEKDYLDSLLALWVASSTTPVSVVNDEKFKDFLANLNPEVSQDDSIFKFILCKV